jgi:hypothetical protein
MSPQENLQQVSLNIAALSTISDELEQPPVRVMLQVCGNAAAAEQPVRLLLDVDNSGPSQVKVSRPLSLPDHE